MRGRPGDPAAEARAVEAGPDPSRISNLEELSRELNLLRARAARGTRSARVSLGDLARRIGEAKSSVHAYVSGARLAPAQTLDRIVIALGATDQEQGQWAEAWYRVGAARPSTPQDSGSVAAERALPHQLPSAVDNFLGRTEELRLLDELMSTGDAGSVVALCGTAGVGKTALALHWAQTRTARFADGQLYVDLRGFDPLEPRTPGHALAQLLRGLGIPNQRIARDVDERAAQLRTLLSGRRMLLVLDNARDTEQVCALLPGPPSCTLLTSRNSMTGLVARHGAHRLLLDLLPGADAVALLQVLIGGGGRGAGWRSRAVDLAALAEWCARLPLALRIAADVASREPEWLADELSSGGQPLDVLDAGDDSRTAIRSAFFWSYRQLPEPAARVFRLMGAHPGPDLSVDAVAALAETTGAEARRNVLRLEQAHLVQQRRLGSYGLHSLLWAYARELALAVDGEAARERAPARLRSCPDPAVRRPILLPRPALPPHVESQSQWAGA